MNQLDEVKKNGDSVTISAEGHFITFVVGEGGRLKYTAFSRGYFGAFRFRPACRAEHEEAAMREFEKPFEEKLSLKKKKERGKGKNKKEIIDPYDLNKNPYPVNSARFPTEGNGEYAGHHAAHIANYVSVLFRNEKRSGATKPDFKEIADRAFKELGFVGKNLGAVYSALSKEIWRRRKAKAKAIAKRKIDEARQAEFAHLLPLEN